LPHLFFRYFFVLFSDRLLISRLPGADSTGGQRAVAEKLVITGWLAAPGGAGGGTGWGMGLLFACFTCRRTLDCVLRAAILTG
jgi:hypothetical protein